MSFTYDPALREDKDQVRFLVGDTNESKAKFQDEEIAWVLRTEENVYTASASLCERLVVAAGSVKSKKIGDLSITYDPMFYARLAGQLRARGAGNQVPFAGGISVSDKLRTQQDADNTAPSVFRRLDDNPAAPTTAPLPPVPPLEQV